MKHQLNLLAAAAILAVAAPMAFADDQYLMATSTIHKLRVTAEGGPAWCQPVVHLHLVLEPGSPDAGSTARQIAVMNLLKTPITRDCKAATTAELTVSGPGAVAGRFIATAGGGWAFAAVPPSSATAAPAALPQPLPPPRVVVKPPPSPVQPQVPAQAQAAAPAPIPALPRDYNYAGALLAYIHTNPSLARDPKILRWWAAYRYFREYQKVWNQEFKIQPLLEQAKEDLAQTLAQRNGQLVTVLINSQFGTYDFSRHQFPIMLNAQQVSVSNPIPASGIQGIPITFVFKVPDLDSITVLPMEPVAAQIFEEKRTRWGNVDRQIAIAVTIKLDASGFTPTWGNLVAAGTLESATIFANARGEQPLYEISSAELGRMRAERAAQKAALAKAEAERQAELRRQQLMAQRQQNIQFLSNSSASTKMANWISDRPLDYSARLNNLRWARAAALISGRPTAVRMLVQMDSSGRAEVETRWPGHLLVNVPEEQPEMKASEWYLVQGYLKVPDGDSLPAAQLAATSVYACTQPKCADATDATAIVDRKIAALGGRR